MIQELLQVEVVLYLLVTVLGQQVLLGLEADSREMLLELVHSCLPLNT